MRTRVKLGWMILLLLMLGLLAWAFISRRMFEPALETGCEGAPTPSFATPRPIPTSLKGTRIMLNPGHGMTLTDADVWGFQRPQPNGISVFVLEDDSNIRLARSLKKVLEEAGAIVVSTRELENDELGESGLPIWREASRHHLERQGVNQGIWNSRGFSLRGDCRLAQDIRARALYANQQKADLLLSLHSNAGNPLARGTQIFYANRSFLRAAQPNLGQQNACLAQELARAIPKSIRLERPDLAWADASFTASNQYGENGFALMPSAIIEVAFHTNAVDGAALRQESFRIAVAKGIKEAISRLIERSEAGRCVDKK